MKRRSAIMGSVRAAENAESAPGSEARYRPVLKAAGPIFGRTAASMAARARCTSGAASPVTT